MNTPTIEQIIEATDGKLARDERSVIVGYGSLGYLRLFPDSVIFGGQELPAVRIEGRLARRDGALQSELRAKLRAAGLEVR